MTVIRVDMKTVLVSTASIMLHRMVTLLAVRYVTALITLLAISYLLSVMLQHMVAGYQLSALSYVTALDNFAG